MHSKMFDEKIVEVEFCANKCGFNNHEKNWCSKYNCSLNDIDDCEFVNYDSHSRSLIIGDHEEITLEEESKIWEIINKEYKEGKSDW